MKEVFGFECVQVELENQGSGCAALSWEIRSIQPSDLGSSVEAFQGNYISSPFHIDKKERFPGIG